MSKLFNFAVYNLDPGDLSDDFEIAAANLSAEELSELYLAIVLDHMRQSRPGAAWTDVREDFDLYQRASGLNAFSANAKERLQGFMFYMMERFPELSLDIRENGRVAKEWFAERRAAGAAQKVRPAGIRRAA